MGVKLVFGPGFVCVCIVQAALTQLCQGTSVILCCYCMILYLISIVSDGVRIVFCGITAPNGPFLAQVENCMKLGTGVTVRINIP